MINKKGFTLIELLAVIVVLAILLVIAIPAVSNYITNSKKGSFLSDAKMFLDAARNNSTIEESLPQDKNDKVIIKISDLNMEKDMQKSPYGNSWISEKSYVVIENIGSNEVPKYSYSIALEDEKGYCLNLTLEDKLSVVDIKKNSCNIPEVGVSGSRFIEKLALTNTTELMTDSSGNIHYYGKNPKNYVTFNGEKAGWRILGVFTVDGERRIKLVKQDVIGNYSWDNKDKTTGASGNYGSNDWSTSTLMKVLNPGYEDVGGSIYWNSSSGKCPSGVNNTFVDCNFSSNGLTEEAKEMIVKSTFNVGGSSDFTMTASEIMEKEKEETWQGYVGLMSASDYAYASNLNSCTSGLNGYNSSNCAGTNFLVISTYEWLISRNPDTDSKPFFRATVGSVSSSFNATSTGKIRPVVYLNANVKFIGDGNGSSSSPYVLSKY